MARTVERIANARGYLLQLKMDNSPELFSVTLAAWPSSMA